MQKYFFKNILKLSLITMGLMSPLCAMIIAPIDTMPAKIAWIEPNVAAQNTPFTLTLNKYAFNCSYSYTNISATVIDQNIYLYYTYYSNPAIRCMQPFIVDTNSVTLIQDLSSMGPTFKIAGLKLGVYKVYDAGKPYCDPNKLCGFYIDPSKALIDTLVVTDPNAMNYHLSTKNVLPGQSFSLGLLSHQFNCGTQYTYMQVAVHENDHNIRLYFVAEDQLDMACILLYKAYGPTFIIPALKAGKYEVRAAKLEPCMVQVPNVCKMAVTSEFVDTLIVSSGVAIFKNGKGASSENPELRNGILTFNASKQGMAQATLFSISGKILNQINFPVLQTGRVQMPIPQANRSQKEMHTLVLKTPDGVRKTFIMNSYKP